LSPAPVRYLSIQMGQGDGRGSIAELAAYCSLPGDIAASMKVVGDPPRVEPVDTTTTEKEEARLREQRLHRVLYVVAGALVLLGLWARKRRSSARGEPEADANDSATVDEILRLMFLASGCAALIYEVVWLHLLRLVIGASSMSVGIVLASFMGGMFLGSAYFARLVPREKNPLQVYGLLEIGIGVFGLLMPLVLPAVRSVYVGLVGYGSLGIALRAVIAALLLLPPTALMGATLPAVARRFSAGRKGMSGLAWLYAFNTIGAVLGGLLAGFYLMATWNVWVATFTAVALNLVVGVGALRLARSTPHEREQAVPVTSLPEGASARRSLAVYWVVGLSGLTALGAQVLWTRLLTLLFGATVYAFSIILAVFLGGLGIGSALAAYLLRRGVAPLRGLAFGQLLLVPALFLSGRLIATVLPFASPPASTPVNALHAMHVLRAIDVILPAALLWGVSFPFALAAASAGQADTGKSSGQVYAANTIGAILGALCVSFLLVPTWGTHRAEQVLVVVAAGSAALAFHANRLARERAPLPRRAGLGIPEPLWVLAAGVLAASLLPGMPRAFLAHGRYLWWVDPRDQYPYVSEGAASTVAVHVAPDGYRHFHVSGRVEASNNPNDLRTERLIGHLSAFAHPRPESVLVVGLGAGISAGTLGLHPEVRRIVICEIEPRVAGAARQFSKENYAILDDPRVEMVFDDARHFLATTRESFDIITSDPIHPWVRGNSILFSREYYEIVKARLKPGGIATQWVPLYETNEAAIQIQMATFVDAFPNGTVWNTAFSRKGYDVVLVGGVEPPQLDVLAIQARIQGEPRLNRSLREVKIYSAVDLLATYGTNGADMQGWLGETTVNNDFSLKLEYISGLALNKVAADPIYEHMIADRKYPDALFVAPPALKAELRRQIFKSDQLSQLPTP
jgi:spermidine synthase